MKSSRVAAPIALKLAYTSFMAVLVPVYAHIYGPANFLYFCDIALFLTLAGLWLDNRQLISMCAVGILAPQLLWLVDFAAHFLGFAVTGVTGYMFDAGKPLFLRALSLFHGWLPLLLLYLVARNGYDGRGLKLWIALSWIVLPICYLFLPGPTPNPGNAAVNINYVHGFGDTAAQTWVHPLVWLAGLMVLPPLLLYWPTHLMLQRWKGMRPQL